MERDARKMIAISSHGAQIADTTADEEKGGKLSAPNDSAPARLDQPDRQPQKKSLDGISANEDSNQGKLASELPMQTKQYTVKEKSV